MGCNASDCNVKANTKGNVTGGARRKVYEPETPDELIALAIPVAPEAPVPKEIQVGKPTNANSIRPDFEVPKFEECRKSTKIPMADYEKIIKLRQKLGSYLDLSKNEHLTKFTKIVGVTRQGSSYTYHGMTDPATGLPDGVGLWLVVENDRSIMHEGYFSGGRYHGNGRSIYSTRQYFEGEYKNGKKDGFGVHHWPSGAKRGGNHKDGVRDGKCVLYTYTYLIYCDLYYWEWCYGWCGGSLEVAL